MNIGAPNHPVLRFSKPEQQRCTILDKRVAIYTFQHHGIPMIALEICTLWTSIIIDRRICVYFAYSQLAPSFIWSSLHAADFSLSRPSAQLRITALLCDFTAAHIRNTATTDIEIFLSNRQCIGLMAHPRIEGIRRKMVRPVVQGQRQS